MVSESHLAYLSLGSNIKPEANLPAAVNLLNEQGEIQTVSSVWESEPIGTTGPNYLNACVLFKSGFRQEDLKETVITPIERRLGRYRSADKFAPRPIDIDIVIFNGRLVNTDVLNLAFVVVPLSEILPSFPNLLTGETLQETATRLRQGLGMEVRRGILG